MPSVYRESHLDQDQGVVDLSNHGLKSTECLPGGISPFTLLLNNNDISKVENLQYFTHLQQLSLADNHIVDMKGTGAAVNLRVLDLSNNSIVVIEGISSLQKLEWLNLSGNSIEKIQNLDYNTNLYHLDLSDNSIAALSGLRALKKLKTLLVHGNLISSLAVIKDQLSSTVQTLSLADNEILDLTEMVYLSSLVNLEQLTVLNNPCVMPSISWRLEVHFRPYLLYCCAGLRNLDGFLVSDEERILSNVLEQAFHEIGHPSHGQHVQLVFTLHHICNSGQQVKGELSTATQVTTQDEIDDSNCDKVLESESFYLPVPSPDTTLTTESDDPIMSNEEAFRLLSLAATMIQAHVRGFLVRKKFNFFQYRKRKHAASLIQATWRGYRARTLDIKVVNIRNELRLKRLMSVIDHLRTMVEREQEKTATNRAQVLQAVRYLWHQIREQNKANQIKSHRKKERAALKLQSWWRGCLVRKAYPHISRNTSKDKIHILFATCFSLQKQLNLVTSQIREMQKDLRRKEILPPEDLSGSDGQEQYYDTTAKLDTSEENNAVLSSCSEYDPVESNMASSSNTQLELVEEHSTLSYCELEPIEGNMASASNSQVELVDDNMASSNIPWANFGETGTLEDSKDLSSKDNVATDKSSHPDSLQNKIVPPTTEPLGFSEDNVVPSSSETADPHKEIVPLNTELVDSYHCNIGHSNAVSLNPQVGNVAPSNYKASCDNTVAPSSVSEQGPLQSTTLPSGRQSTNGCQENFVAKKLFLQVGTPSSEDDLSRGDQHRMTIPKIVVTRPTEDDCSDKDSASEEDTTGVHACGHRDKEQTIHPEKPADGDPSKSPNNSDISRKGKSTEKSSFIEQFVTNHAKKGDFLTRRKQADHSIVSKVNGSSNSEVQKNISFSEMRNEKDTESNPVKKCEVEISKETLPNLGERATNLLSQLRSEIASMKSARLSSVSLETEMVTVSENEKESEVFEKTDEVKLVGTCLVPVAGSQVEPGGTPQAGSASYRLPLFEDVAMSFSLDDLLVDADGEGNGEPFTTVTVKTFPKSCSTTECDEGFRSDDTDVSFDTKM